MTSIFTTSIPWHPGEISIHDRLHVPPLYDENPTMPGLDARGAYQIATDPLLAVGALDAQKRPWTTVWGGEPGIGRALGNGLVGVRAVVDGKFDPVVQALVGGVEMGDVVKEQSGKGRMVGGLAIDLMARNRWKLFGRMVAAGLMRSQVEDDENGGANGKEKNGERRDGEEMIGEADDAVGEIQLVQKIEQSLGNCPKYLNKKVIRPARPKPRLVERGKKLPVEAIKVINKADLFFISSSREEYDMDTNHRGGPAGFVRVMSNGSDGAEIVYPEYSGNRLYQTLGNLTVTPLAGLCFPDFDTGDVLYLTGRVEILAGQEAADILPRSNLAVKLKVDEAIFVKEGLAFRGDPKEPSPYNPHVRLLVSEGNIISEAKGSLNSAKLLSKEEITPTIHRYRFSMTNPVPYKAGQWVAMDFSGELDMGYSHMRDDDPQSLNDDFVRTFTVSSPPLGTEAAPHDEFELTLRLHGPVTNFLKRQKPGRNLELPIKGFGGDFEISTPAEQGIVPFIAGGVGITPVLGQLPSLDLNVFRLYWILRVDDCKFVEDIFARNPGLAKCTTVFFTGVGNMKLSVEQTKTLEAFKSQGATIELRRPDGKDFESVDALKWYLCAGNPLRGRLLGWLHGRTVVYENFDY